jgi:hypothetical protein
VEKKKNKVRLIYAYRRESGEIAAYVMEKRDIKTAEKLRKRIKEPGISYDRVVRTTGRAFWRPSGETGVWRERRIRRGLRGKLPTEAPGKAGVSEDMLFFQDSGEPPESV